LKADDDICDAIVSHKLFNRTNGFKAYDIIVQNDYMNHRILTQLISASIHDIILISSANISNIRPYENISLADLGCGNLAHMSEIYSELPLKQFTAVDLSSLSITYARENLLTALQSRNKTIPRISWQETDISSWLNSQKVQEKFDVIISKYAIHHIYYQDKNKVFANLKNRLNQNGLFFYADIFTKDNETRAEFLIRSFGNIQSTWSALSADQSNDIMNHIENNDFPLSIGQVHNLIIACKCYS
jgi:SAM-dependent methyltransferase